MKKLTRKQINSFNDKLVEALEFYGAEKLDDGFYIMDSQDLGKLIIRLDYDISAVYTVYARFADVEKAMPYFNISPFNGKINMHSFQATDCIWHLDGLLNTYCKLTGQGVYNG